MSKFKVGQRVVYIGGCINPNMQPPEINEIVIINGISPNYDNAYYLEGFLFAPCGTKQCFVEICLRPLDDTFAEETLSRIAEEIEKEELILI